MCEWWSIGEEELRASLTGASVRLGPESGVNVSRGVLMATNPFHALQERLARLFSAYGLLVARHPRPFIIFPTLLTLVLSTGLFRLSVQDDLRFLYSPVDSPSRLEYKIHDNFSAGTVNSTYLAVAVESNDDDANLLRKKVTDEILKLNGFILNNLTFTLDDHLYNFGEDICPRIALCPLSNAIVKNFFNSYWNKKLQADPRIKIKYPVMQYYDHKLFLPTHLYGVKVDSSNSIVGIRMVHLLYLIPATEKDPAERVEQAIANSVREHLQRAASIIRTSMFSLSLLKAEMHKNATYTFPFISLTVLLLVAFTVGSCMTGDWITSKPIEALLGVLSSSFAILSAAGLLFHLGVPFVSQVTVMPFLALAIGVDDTYVMLGAWQDTKRSLSPDKRMALSMAEAGSAITVTSITSALSFGIGALSSTPAISIFCKFIAVAVIFDWFYQVTVFAAIMALGGRRESAGYHCIFVWKRMPKADIVQAKSEHFISPTYHFFANHLAPFLCAKPTRICVLASYVVYISMAFYGCSLLSPNLTPSRLLVDDSPLAHYLHLAESQIWAEGVIGRVYINRAPDFAAHPEEIDKFMLLVESLEETPYSMGRNSTQLWLRDFLHYRQFFAEQDNSRFYDTLNAFLKVSFNAHWSNYLHWQPRSSQSPSENDNDSDNINNNYVDRFFFTTAFRIRDWNVRTTLLLKWRNITAAFPEYEAMVFDENNFYSDQMLELKSTALSSLGTAVISILLVCIIFIGEATVVFWVAFCLVSMDIGVAGYLSLWGADLDPTTVVNILMSIGLCIDFATHVGYRIYRSEEKDADRRIRDALGAIGWPVVQGGVSTFLAIVVMMLVPSHVVRMFARTSVLVVLTGLFHGVVLLPVIVRTFASSLAFDSRKD